MLHAGLPCACLGVLLRLTARAFYAAALLELQQGLLDVEALAARESVCPSFAHSLKRVPGDSVVLMSKNIQMIMATVHNSTLEFD